MVRLALADPFSLTPTLRKDLNRQRKRPLFTSMQGTHTDHLARNLLPSIVANRKKHGVFPRLAAGGMPDRTFDPKWGETGQRLDHPTGIEAKVVLAGRTDDRSFQHYRSAVGANA